MSTMQHSSIFVQPRAYWTINYQWLALVLLRAAPPKDEHISRSLCPPRLGLNSLQF